LCVSFIHFLLSSEKTVVSGIALEYPMNSQVVLV
jgi:hypothetical protein